MMRYMNWSNSGTVKAESTCPGLQTIPFLITLLVDQSRNIGRSGSVTRDGSPHLHGILRSPARGGFRLLR